MALSLAEVAKEIHLRVDQDDDSGVPALTKSGMFEIVKGVFDIFSQALVAGESIAVPKFGKFESYIKPARKGRNPSTNEALDIPEKLAVKFKPSSTLRAQLSEVNLSKIKKTIKPKKKAPAKAKKGKKKKK